MSYDFSLDRKGSIILSLGSVFLIVLVFFAGFLTGMTWRPESRLVASARPPSVAASISAPPAPPAAQQAPAAKPARPETAAPAPSQPAEPPPAKAADPSGTKPPAAEAETAAPAAPRAADQGGVRLSVQVGAFREKGNAQKLADQLKNSGYTPHILLAGSGQTQWSIVRVGPYQDWDEATQIAALLSRDQGTPAVVRPMR